jgi:hypothetical protein
VLIATLQGSGRCSGRDWTAVEPPVLFTPGDDQGSNGTEANAAG